MSQFTNVSTSPGYPSVSFKQVGDDVAGIIVAFEDYQETVYGSKELKTYPSGDPIMGVRVHLELVPGDESSRVTLWAQGKLLMKAIAIAMKNAGVSDIGIGDQLAVKFTGYDGRAKTYSAAYEKAETDEAPF